MDIEQFFLQYYRPLCLYALRFLNDIDKTEDIVQDCFVKLLEDQRTLSYKEGFREKDFVPIFFRTVHNRCIDQLRREERLSAIPIDMVEDEMDFPFSAARLWTAIDALPDRCREVFLMAKRDGMTYREIAEELGISERTVEHQVSKALRILRGKSQDFFRLVLLTLSA